MAANLRQRKIRNGAPPSAGGSKKGEAHDPLLVLFVVHKGPQREQAMDLAGA